MKHSIFVIGIACVLTLQVWGQDDDDEIPKYVAPPLSRLSVGQTSQQANTQNAPQADMTGGQASRTLPEGARPLQMGIASRYPILRGMPRVEPELAPIYVPQNYPTDPRFANQSIPQNARGANVPNGQEYWQSVYWPYRYQQYEQGSYWPYRHWPYENDLPWQGGSFPYEKTTGQRDYATLMPPNGAASKGPSYPLNEDERAELEMWRRLASQPLEVIVYGNEAYVTWAGAMSRVPIPKNGKIQIKLSPGK